MAAENDKEDIEKEEGYDVEFVKDANKISTDDLTCVICLNILREPMQAVPCGHRFCKNCINRVQKQEGSKVFVCPIDRKEVQVFPDAGKGREILNFHVKCTNNNLSCNWTGELRELKKHLQGCQFVSLACEKDCGKINILRHQMAQHLESKCPKNIFACKYAKIGCLVKGRKRFLSGHVKEDFDHHLTLQMEQQQQKEEAISKLEKTSTKQELKIAQLVDKISQQNDKIKKQGKVLEHLKSTQQGKPDDKIVNDQSELGGACNFITLPKGPFTFQIENFDEKFGRTYEIMPLEPFYFLNGYKGRLVLFLIGNNDKDKGHIAVYFDIMKGSFDDTLEWPMTFALITVSLVINGECKLKGTINCKQDEERLKTIFVKPINKKGRRWGRWGRWGRKNFFLHENIPKILQGDIVSFTVYVTRL